ncbi:UDP-N-acetylglucosamine pyrophosphorylase [Clostridium sartagoforme]|uniref:UDP-N-acetylglucosamine pyrophosphorylase n=1 Tax=Clostridium sartagoforme TaxID=84031 RepID=A0A4S2DNB7_9CLOT|nr:UDP-N-acetylglucosamine pyrophosphorylase [Clostridium sartagoforme]TGY43839.1 UDP-N-acetylglucosamine pyrophosphorylase [Clostridium sartagoforme]
MKYDLSIYELGQLLTKLTKDYKVELLSKAKLSGGWMTIVGEVDIISVPEDKVVIKGNNIITMNIKDQDCGGSYIKITGAKNGVFNIDIANTKYKELGGTGISLNKTKINEDECKLRIDEDMIFTIRNAKLKDIEALI